ncbi:MAG TPA: hypothetical protein ENH25_06475 [candidate division Zixibacteria bacterium]|nr:hypothetical protein [candidate division Zixibacteria bacterium]
MKKILEFDIEDLIPAPENVLRSQGIPPGAEIPEKISELADLALELFAELCEPAGLIGDLSVSQFREIYSGEGRNEILTPVAKIFPLADHLALFAMTVGEPVGERIAELFDTNEFALASMLDTTASEATELAGIYSEQAYLEDLITAGDVSPESFIMRYSPGYCGWHISGQRKLFEYLEPENIGISLTNSYMMRPLKSISGVMLVGPANIHKFDITYPFCDQCIDKGCRARIRAMGN